MSAILPRVPIVYTQQTNLLLADCDFSRTAEPYRALDALPAQKSRFVNSFHAYRDSADYATDLHPIPTMVAGGYYGSRAPVKHAVEPDDPIELVHRAVKALTALPTTNRRLESASRAHEAATVTIDARLAVFRKAISVLKRFRPVTLASFTAGPVDKWTARLEGFSALKKGWDSYTAAAPSKGALASASEFLDTIRELGKEPSKLNPSVVGGVGFTFRRDRRAVYIEFRNTGNTHAMFTDGVSKPRVVKVRQDRAGYEDILALVETHFHELPTAASPDVP